jgi:hypothetical protein
MYTSRAKRNARPPFPSTHTPEFFEQTDIEKIN